MVRVFGRVSQLLLLVLGVVSLAVAAWWVDWSVRSAWWVALPILLAAGWSLAAFHLSRLPHVRVSDSPFTPGQLHVLVLVDGSCSVESVVVSVSTAPSDAVVVLVGDARASHLADSLGVGFCPVSGVVELLASFPGDDVVLPLAAGVRVDPVGLAASVATMGEFGASWSSCLPGLEAEDAYLPPAPLAVSKWWWGNALSSSSRVWLPSATLVRAGSLSPVSALSPDGSFAGLLRGMAPLAAGVPAPVSFTSVPAPYDASEFFSRRLLDTSEGLSAARAGLFSRGSRLSSRASAAALWLRLARGVPMLVAFTAPMVLALTGVVFTRVPLTLWLGVLLAPVAVRGVLLFPSVVPPSFSGRAASSMFEFTVSLRSALSALFRRPAPGRDDSSSWILLFLTLVGAACVGLGAFLGRASSPEAAAVRSVGMLGVLVFVTLATASAVRCTHLRRSGRASVRVRVSAAASVGGVSATLVDASVGGALFECVGDVPLSRSAGGAVLVEVPEGPGVVSAFVVREFVSEAGARCVSVTFGGDRRDQLTWAAWVLSLRPPQPVA